jgi:hypothetical protein
MQNSGERDNQYRTSKYARTHKSTMNVHNNAIIEPGDAKQIRDLVNLNALNRRLNFFHVNVLVKCLTGITFA